MLDNKFRGAIFHPLTRMKEPSSTNTEAVWTLMELHGQSSYVMYQGCFVSSKNGTLKLSSQLFFFLFPPQGLCSLVANFYQRLGCNFDFFALLIKADRLFSLHSVAPQHPPPSPLWLVYAGKILVKERAVVSLGKGIATLRNLNCPLVVGSSIENVNLRKSGQIKNKGLSSNKDDEWKQRLGNDDFRNNFDEGQNNFYPV